MNADDLRAFAADVAAEFNAGRIRAPVHLDGGNEEQLIRVFETIERADWVAGSWRMMSKCLLHGVPAAELKAEVMAGRAMTLCFPRQRIVSSAIVGGILPIALGIALEIKRAGGTNRVHVFSGDMTAATGIFHECQKYAGGHGLPIRFIIENNSKSVMSDTEETWGHGIRVGQILPFSYSLDFPHAGAGKRVQF